MFFGNDGRSSTAPLKRSQLVAMTNAMLLEAVSLPSHETDRTEKQKDHSRNGNLDFGGISEEEEEEEAKKRFRPMRE